METFDDLKHLAGKTVKIKIIEDITDNETMIVAECISSKQMFVIDRKKKNKPGRKPKNSIETTATETIPKKNYSKDFLKNDSLKMEDEKVLDKELESIDRSKQKKF